MKKKTFEQSSYKSGDADPGEFLRGGAVHGVYSRSGLKFDSASRPPLYRSSACCPPHIFRPGDAPVSDVVVPPHDFSCGFLRQRSTVITAEIKKIFSEKNATRLRPVATGDARSPRDGAVLSSALLVSLFVCLLACLLAGLWKNYSSNFHKIRWAHGHGRNQQISMVIRITLRQGQPIVTGRQGRPIDYPATLDLQVHGAESYSATLNLLVGRLGLIPRDIGRVLPGVRLTVLAGSTTY